MEPPRQIPSPSLPTLEVDKWSSDLGTRLARYLAQCASRLNDWVNAVAMSYRALTLRQVSLESTAVATEFTVPYQIADAADGTAMALLFSDGAVVEWTATDPPPAGKYTIRRGPMNAQTIVLGTAPANGAFFGFLVSR